MELVAHNRHLWSLNEDNSLKDEICQEVRVSYKERDLLNGSTTACITICHDDGDEEYKIEKKRLNRKMIQEFLMDKDIAIADDDDTTADVVDYIRDTDKMAPVQYYHRKLGFELYLSCVKTDWQDKRDKEGITICEHGRAGDERLL